MKPDQFEHVFKLPFAEASQFFRDKLNIPTESWTELSGAAHAKGFTSAGAYNADLLAELRAMTDKAISGGMDIREFRSQFRQLVGRYGWQLKGGGPSWRSDLIWRTNMRTAYQAGRWQQFREGGVEYLKYVHADGVMHPRPNHLAMDGMILPIDDPFWSANYPPNGWGCKCRAVAARKREYDAAETDRTTRPDNWRDLADGGWNYNVGQAGEEMGYRALTEKFETLPNDIARAWMRRWINEPAFARFIEGKIEGEFPVAVLKDTDIELLGTDSQTIWLSAETLAKNKGLLPTRSAGHPELTLEDYRLLPEIIDSGEVYRQSDERFIYLRIGDVAYRAAIKRTRDRSRNYLLSLFKGPVDSRVVEQLQGLKFERIR